MEGIQLDGVALTDTPKEPVKSYPLIEELTFKAHIKNEEEGYALLMSIQVLVNELGTEQIVSLFNKLKSNPSLLLKAKKYLPYISML